MRYKCPNCNFPVFNRRVAKCESCNAPLPTEILYSKEQTEAIDAEFEKNKAQVAQLKKRMGVVGSGDSGGDWGSCDGGGCDGGGGGD